MKEGNAGRGGRNEREGLGAGRRGEPTGSTWRDEERGAGKFPLEKKISTGEEKKEGLVVFRFSFFCPESQIFLEEKTEVSV